jgi:hypothetical protein
LRPAAFFWAVEPPRLVVDRDAVRDVAEERCFDELEELERDVVERFVPVDADDRDFAAVALPPLRPAAFFCAVVPPCFDVERVELEDEPDFLPPRLDAPGEFEMRAARSFDIPFSLSFSYCFSFLTLGRLPGIDPPTRS